MTFRTLLFLLLVQSTAFCAEGFKTAGIVLYQPDDVLKERVSSADVIAEYFKKLEAVTEEHFKKHARPANLDLVIAIKPDYRVKCWLQCTDASLSKELADLRLKIEAIKPIEVTGGPFAFAVRGQLAGGVEVKNDDGNGPPIPDEWKAAAKDVKESLMVPDGFLKLVWPDLPGEKSSVAAPRKPVEFIKQILEPTGGEIDRPKDWFFTEGHRGKTLMWTISAEDNSKGRYTTGVRIQLFIGVKEQTGQTPEEFIRAFVAGKKEKVEVIEECDATDQGLFKRICLEVVEGDYHILYSLFWGKEMDMAAVSISGTTKALWSKHAATFDRMARFKAIDMDHLQKKAAEGEKENKASEKKK
jgi:hypothetical protein